MIPKLDFGSTGHLSTRILFGAAALGGMKQEKADTVLAQLLDAGINHIDTAASYGESELRVGPWMAAHRDDFFVATKTGDRTAAGARASLERSLERLQVDSVDMIQLHNLVDEEGWQTAMGPGGAVEAMQAAKEEGLVRFIGVTGHGTQVAAMHLRSLDQFSFDSVLFPYNYTMLDQPDYAADVASLRARCQRDGVAMQTIKAVARRRWQDGDLRKFSWYEPFSDPEAVGRAVHFVLGQPDLFFNTSSDARLLAVTLAAAARPIGAPTASEIARDVAEFEMEPLFTPGAGDSI